MTTGATLTIPPSDLVFGSACQSDQVTHATGCIIYVQVEESSFWNVNIGTLRSQDLASYFDYTRTGGDRLVLEVACSPAACSPAVVPTDQDNRMEAVALPAAPSPTEEPAPSPTTQPAEVSSPTPAAGSLAQEATTPTPPGSPPGQSAPVPFLPWGLLILAGTMTPAMVFLLWCRRRPRRS